MTTDDVVESALAAFRDRDWDGLRPLLHPYLHWDEGASVVRGRTKVMALLRSSRTPIGPPSYVELRDGQIYRWTT